MSGVITAKSLMIPRFFKIVLHNFIKKEQLPTDHKRFVLNSDMFLIHFKPSFNCSSLDYGYREIKNSNTYWE